MFPFFVASNRRGPLKDQEFIVPFIGSAAPLPAEPPSPASSAGTANIGLPRVVHKRSTLHGQGLVSAESPAEINFSNQTSSPEK